MAEKILVHQKTGKQWLIRDTDKDFHTQYGAVTKKDIKRKSGSCFQNKQKCKFMILEASFIDRFMRLKRKAQVILPKDAAIILAMTGADSTTRVVDAGGGSGWLTCFLANYVKQVYSYDIVDAHIKVIKDNVERLGFTNVKVKKHDIYTSIPVKPDLLTLDVPEPWRVLPLAKEKVKKGGYVVCYSPSISQSQGTVNAATELGLLVLDTVEVRLRSWDIAGRKVRPKRDEIGPTGFLTFIRII
jgi:tRNA (adenine57-N1/adenine58-N1)-methyltransferase catalytic subunit